MNFWGPLIGGMLARKYETDAENRRQGEMASQREAAVFTHLLSADDPETRNLALAGLLDSANPRRKAGGLRGWIGETLASPYLAKIQALSPTVTEQHPETINLPGETQGIPGPVPGSTPQPALTQPPTSAGMPPTSPVQPGAPPPTPTTTTTPAPQWASAPPTPYTFLRTVQRPREAFLGPTEKATQLAGAKEVGDIGGMRAGLKAAGFGDEEAAGIIRQHLARKYAAGLPYQHVNVEVPDGKGGYYTAAASYDRTSGQYLDDNLQPMYGARPVSSTASSSMGVAIEPLAKAMFGKRGVQLTQPEMAQVLEASKLQKAEMSPKDAMAAARQVLPYGTVQQQADLADAYMAATKAPSLGAPPPPTGAAAVQSQIGGTVEQPSGAPPAPAAVTPPKKGGLGAALTPDQAGANKDTGKPLPSAVAMALAKAKSTNDVIDQAVAALTPFKDDTSLQGAIDLAAKYRQGVYDPVNGAAVQLADLAGLQQKAQANLTGGSSRALQFYIDRSQHVPKIPSIRQVQANRVLSADTVQNISGAIKNDAGTFDSPQQMYEKLLRAKSTNMNFIKELESATREPMRAMPSHEPSAGAPGSAYKDANGVWHIRQD
jgi:hypothetical protein